MRSARSGSHARTRSSNTVATGPGRRRNTKPARVAPLAAAAVSTSLMSSSPSPGIIGATFTPTSSPAAASLAIVWMRRSGDATNGSIARALSGSQSGIEMVTDTRATRGALQHVEVALDQRRLGDDRDRIAIIGAHLAGSRASADSEASSG